jgi:lipopolysaccharide heptosyltransferase II
MDTHMRPSKKRILVVRTDRLGDVVLSSPVLTALKATWPQCHTAMLLRSYTAELLQGHPDLDQIILESEPLQSAFSLARRLRAEHFDLALLLHPTFRLALACRLAGIPVRVGTAFRGYSFLFNRRVPQHRKNSGRHELDLNLEIAAAIGARLEQVTFRLAVSETDLLYIRQKLQEVGLAAAQPFVVLHPGSGGSAMDWPPNRFGQLAHQLVSRLDLPVVLTGSSSERELIDRVAAACDTPLIRLDGILSIKQLAALLQQAALVVANSTGPLHIARAFATPVIGLFCPIPACSPQRWGPYGKPESVLLPDVPRCETCSQRSCAHYNCMDLIPVDQVMALAQKQLRLANHQDEHRSPGTTQKS